MTGSSPIVAGSRQPADRNLWIAVALALGLHALWFIRVPEFPLALDKPPAAPVLQTMFFHEDPAELLERKLSEDVRALQSPSMFSLPTPMGFSRPFLGERRSLRPPLEGPGQEPSPSGMPSNALPQGSLATDGHGTLLRGIEWQRAGSGHESEAFPAAPAATGAVLRIAWMDSVKGLRNQSRPVEPGSVWDDPKPWEALAYVEFDDLGNVKHVLLEKPTSSPARNEEIVRALRGYHSKPGALGQSGYVTLRYAGAESKAKERP